MPCCIQNLLLYVPLLNSLLLKHMPIDQLPLVSIAEIELWVSNSWHWTSCSSELGAQVRTPLASAGSSAVSNVRKAVFTNHLCFHQRPYLIYANLDPSSFLSVTTSSTQWHQSWMGLQREKGREGKTQTALSLSWTLFLHLYKAYHCLLQGSSRSAQSLEFNNC